MQVFLQPGGISIVLMKQPTVFLGTVFPSGLTPALADSSNIMW